MAENLISKIKIGGVDYEIKDAVAREAIKKGFTFVISTDAATTPYGITWTTKAGVEITGTLVASADTLGKIYLVLASGTAETTVYSEYITVSQGEPVSYFWEKIGDTSAQIKGLVKDVKYKGGALTPGSGDNVLGEATTFTATSSNVTFSGNETDTFVKSYPGTTSKLELGSVTGIDGSQSVTGIESNIAVTASKATAAADLSASKVVTEEFTATNTVFGTATTASKVTAGTAVDVAKAGTAVTVNAFASALTDLVRNLHVSDETLTFDVASTAAQSIIPAEDNGTITPYTATDVTVPVVTSNASVTKKAVKSTDDVTITQFTFADVNASKVVSATAFQAAKPASTSTTVATGSLVSTGTGADVMTGLGTADTATAIKTLGTGTAAAQTITVGTTDIVKVAKYDDAELNVTKVS